MAYAALVSLSQTTDLILNNAKYSLSDDEKLSITSIHEYVNYLISFLEGRQRLSGRREDRRIRGIAKEAEDIIELFMWKQIRMKGRVVELSRAEFGRQLGEVTEKIGLIAGEMMDEPPVGGDSTPSVSSSPDGKNLEAIGLESDLEEMNDRLCGRGGSSLQVIPIVGMGGIGKTTLAQKSYNNQLIIQEFRIRAWITLSQDYSFQNIASTLIDSLKKQVNFETAAKSTDTDIDRVYKILKGRKYLIVLDDIWNTEAWDDVKLMFPNDNNGSRIMLTTRLVEVASYAGSSRSHHEMRFMDENQSWDLLKQKVFGNSQRCPQELEETGKDIAGSCGGLPLAVVLVGGILSTLETQASWKEISKDVSSAVGGQLERILSLSYTHLPLYLRPCFLLIGGFPEDYEIRVSRLIKLWVGEGFMKPQNGCKSLEEAAEEYLEDLIKRSLVLVASRKSNNRKIKSCRLHDMVREMCVTKAHEEKFLLHVEKRRGVVSENNERHISISYNSDQLINNIWRPTTHTILSSFLLEKDLAFVANMRLMRVLDVVNEEYKPLPQVFDQLLLLRYLALGNCVEIPSTISNLENLQTLIIRPRFPSWEYLPVAPSSLPLEIWKMPQLRHLDFFYLYELPAADGSTTPLVNLQTLSTVANLVCSERVLEMIPNLKKLGLVFLQSREFYLHNLALLHRLEKLKLTLFHHSFWRGQVIPAFPNTLRKLTLVGGQLQWRQIGIVGSLPNLEVLKLRVLACIGDTWEISDDEFPKLQYLLIDGSYLQHWITPGSPFPRLKSLVLHHCPNLSEIPENVGEISSLEVIEVDYLNTSLMESARQIQEDQRENYGNYSLEVRCVHSWKHDRLGVFADLRL